MNRETKHQMRDLAYYSSLGFSVALSIFIGLFIGIYFDRHFETNPWFTLIFLCLGIAAGFRNLGLAVRKSKNL